MFYSYNKVKRPESVQQEQFYGLGRTQRKHGTPVDLLGMLWYIYDNYSIVLYHHS